MLRCRVLVPLLVVAASSAAAQPSTDPRTATADSLFFAGQWSKAKTAYDAYLALNPSHAPSNVRAGFSTLKAGLPDQAVPYFERVVRSAPGGLAPMALAGLAIARLLQGDREKALIGLDSAVANGYSNFSLLDQDEWFRDLRGDSRFKSIRDRAERQQMPCLSDVRSRAFDFWIGEWDLYVNGTKRLAGRSRIDRISGGCGILENYTSNSGLLAGPYEGKSINFFDPSTGKWKQVWAGSSHDVTYFDGGEYRDSAMRFTYRRTDQQGRTIEGDFIFYHLGPNKLRQFQDQTTDGGKTRQVVYDFIYVRKGSGESPLFH